MIHTSRLKLVPTTLPILQALLTSDEALSKLLEIQVAPKWTEFGTAPFKYVLEKLTANPGDENWWTWLPIHKEENRLIGSGGYKGGPTEEGVVEIGYEIAPSCRNKGFATEMARGLLQHAFTFPEVQTVIAHTLAQANPSTSVLTKCGFIKTAEIFEPEEGQIWKWELPRSNYG